MECDDNDGDFDCLCLLGYMGGFELRQFNRIDKKLIERNGL